MSEREQYQRYDLPAGWTWCTLADVVESITDGPFGSNLKTSDYVDDGEARVIRLGNIGVGQFKDEDRSFVSRKKFSTLVKHEARPGDVVIAALAEPVGRACLVPEGIGPAIVKADCVRARVDARISTDIVMRWLNSPEGLKSAALASHGIGRLRINLGEIRALPVPLPPSNEQRRIVAKLDAIFERTRGAKLRLERLPTLLEKLKRSILAAAFRGDLTADWRAAHPDVEPASTLLARIRAERRTQWESELRAKGKDPAKSKYEQPTADLQTVAQVVLPSTWARVSVADVAECLDSRRIPVSREDRDKRTGPYPYYGANGQVGSIDDYLFDDELVLVTEDETFYGRVKPIAYRVSGKCWVNNHAHVLRPRSPLRADIICFALMHYQVEPWLSGTTGRAKLTQFDLMRLPIALPPVEEAQEIEDRVRSTLAAIEAIRSNAASALARFETLEEGALAKAFRGELVEQDSNDEPASALIERLRAAKPPGTAKPSRRVSTSVGAKSSSLPSARTRPSTEAEG